MKTPVTESRRTVFVRQLPSSFMFCLGIAGSALLGFTLEASITHPVFVSWIKDQRNNTGVFDTQYFTVDKYDDTGTVNVTVGSTNPAFMPTPAVAPCSTQSCNSNGTNYMVTFQTPFPAPPPGTTPATTITIKARTGTGPMAYTSFTLRKDSAINPPSIGNLQTRYVQRETGGEATYQTSFVVGDLDNDGNEDIACLDGAPGCICPDDPENCTLVNVTAGSDNDTFLPPGSLSLQLMPPQDDLGSDGGPRTWLLTATTNPSSTPGRVTVTVTATDQNTNKTETSFVIKTVASTNVEPQIFNEPTTETYVEQFTGANSGSTTHSFKVTDTGSNLDDLRVRATSSNTRLVPNANLSCSTPDPTSGVGTVTITPVLPLPSPSPGVPQAATITLSVSDDAYVRQTTFLYVAAPGDGMDQTIGGVATAFTRPSGVYSLNPGDVHRSLTFLTGEMHGNDLTWKFLDSADYETFFPAFFENFPLDQQLSLNLQEEPCDIGTTPTCTETGGNTPCLDFPPWCDTNKGGQYQACFNQSTSSCLNGGRRTESRSVG